MSQRSIRDLVEVAARPTVVRLADLESADSSWISATYHHTAEIRTHLATLDRVLARETGRGAFLIGPYGSGKSHFLAYLVQRLAAAEGSPGVVTLSMLNFAAERTLESVVAAALAIETSAADRRETWARVDERHPAGLLLVVDELSEFLRSKASRQAFNEDVRFLQFLGEWASDHRLWVVAAMQEQIEHTGELESSLYRKIKDRFPVRLLLTADHVRALVADSVLVKKEGYGEAVADLVEEVRRALPGSGIDLAALAELYPIHPTTLELLEEVRDLFSQTRGSVEFVLRQLAGDPERGLEPFLARPWGDLLTPDVIVDHFADLFEVQPEFQSLAQRILPFYRRHLAELFPKEAQRQLAWRLVKLLMLTAVSPQREGFTAAEAAAWLLVRATTVAPERNVAVVERTLDQLASSGRFVTAHDGAYRLDLHDDSAERLDERLRREVADLAQGTEDGVWEILVTALPEGAFNPFTLAWDRWQPRRVRWHQHERPYQVWLGNGEPGAAAADDLGLCIRLPWSSPGPAAQVATLVPAPVELDPDLVELAALIRLAGRALDSDLADLAGRRIEEGGRDLAGRLRGAYVAAELVARDGRRENLTGAAPGARLGEWLDAIAVHLLRRRFPSFERFAPSHGPLPKEAYHRLMAVAAKHDIGDHDGDEYVSLIREAYLAPMGLLTREGWYYRVRPNLDKHELVELVLPLLEHRPAPAVVYDHLKAPVYGLVPDQIHLLLIFLYLQGEIELVKGGRSYRDLHPTLPLPIHYERVELGSGLSGDALLALGRLLAAVRLRPPRQWTVTAQRQAVRRLSEAGERRRQTLVPAIRRLESHPSAGPLVQRLRDHAAGWETLIGDDDELRRFERFRHALPSVAAFAEESEALDGLGSQLDRVVGDLKRLTLLLADPGPTGWAEAEVRARLDAVGPPPPLVDLDRVEQWLVTARGAYQVYSEAYRRAHDRWWREIRTAAVVAWSPPLVAASRHLGLAAELADLRDLAVKVGELLCRGCSDLEFRCRCRCGFDGQRAEVSELLDRFAELRKRVELTVEGFFATNDARARVRRFKDEGVELGPGLQAYLAGEVAVPEIVDLDAFDDVFAGVEVVREVAVERFVELFGGRTWRRQDLVATLDRSLEDLGDHLLRVTPAMTVDEGVVGWCLEQSLRAGVPLPAGIRGEPSLVRPAWVSARSLARLEELGLGGETEDAILGWLIAGEIALAPGEEPSPLVAAAREVVAPSPVTGFTDLCRLSRRLYAAHPRLGRVAGEAWRRRLESVAEVALELPPLAGALDSAGDCQWLVVDALGAPLVEVAVEVLERTLRGWAVAGVGAAAVGKATHTAAFFDQLAADGVAHRLFKVNPVDRLLHERRGTFADLERLAAAELEVALRRLDLDPARPVLVFADHGFRLSPDGSAFVHGGPSTLERAVPLIELRPR